MQVALKIVASTGASSKDSCTLTYEERFLRRRVLHTDTGEAFLVDLAHTTSLDHGQAFELPDGRQIGIQAAQEPLMQITAANLLPLVWHIGNRHCPAQIEEDRVLVQPDHVIRALMERLGATVEDVCAPFTPEGGAYGHGRTHRHSHGDAHGHSTTHSHDH